MEICELFQQGYCIGEYLVTACNEVTNFTDLKTRDKQENYVQIDNKEAEHGFVTRIKASG